MSWWKEFIIRSAQMFFATLVNQSPEVREKVRPYAKEIYASIKMAYPGDPDFQ